LGVRKNDFTIKNPGEETTKKDNDITIRVNRAGRCGSQGRRDERKIEKKIGRKVRTPVKTKPGCRREEKKRGWEKHAGVLLAEGGGG